MDPVLRSVVTMDGGLSFYDSLFTDAAYINRWTRI